MNLIICTENNNISNAIIKTGKYDVVKVVNNVNELNSLTMSNYIDTVLFTRKVQCNTNIIDFIIRYKTNNPSIRIIYLTNIDTENNDEVNELVRLIRSEIYDIFYKGNIDIKAIENLLDNPKTKDDLKELLKINKKTTVKKNTTTQENIEVFKSGLPNVIAVTSVKPGTGKSFVASNLATTLAMYGEKANGNKLKVLLMEGDFQTCSVYTLMGVKDDNYNIKKCLNVLKDNILEVGLDSFMVEPSTETKATIEKSCIRLNWLDNLYVLESHDFETMEKIESEYYYYLIHYLSKKFDCIIIDANSNINHETSDPIFQLAGNILYIYTTDFNNIQSNLNCYDKLKKYGLLEKSTFILNRNLSNEEEIEFKNRFNFNDKEILEKTIKTKYIIPEINTSIVYNADYNHKPIVTDKKYYTLPARIEFLKIANKYSKLTNISQLAKEIEDFKSEF